VERGFCGEVWLLLRLIFGGRLATFGHLRENMKAEEIQQIFAGWRIKPTRSAWLRITAETQDSTSWFGRTPSQSASRDWPKCQSCEAPMQFFLQLDLGTLPVGFNVAQRTGLVQLFYCSTDDGLCDTWQPFSGTHDIRLFSKAESLVGPDGIQELRRKSIVGWREFKDTPHPEEHRQYGIAYHDDFANKRVAVSCHDPAISLENLDLDLEVAELVSISKPGDKLGGWPYWVQGRAYPTCPACQNQMELLFQIDSEDNLSYMFSDAGCAHLTQCRTHPHILAFGWAGS
jgi:uncharacterized protein YwqG